MKKIDLVFITPTAIAKDFIYFRAYFNALQNILSTNESNFPEFSGLDFHYKFLLLLSQEDQGNEFYIPCYCKTGIIAVGILKKF